MSLLPEITVKRVFRWNPICGAVKPIVHGHEILSLLHHTILLFVVSTGE